MGTLRENPKSQPADRLKFQILNPKSQTNSKHQITNHFGLKQSGNPHSEVLNLGFRIWSLFGILDLGFIIFLLFNPMFPKLLGEGISMDAHGLSRTTQVSVAFL